MAPWALLHIGPRGGLKMRSPVEDWMVAKARHLDPPRGDAARPAAADLRGGRLCDLQPLPAAGASGGGRRSCGLRRLLRPPRPGRRGTGLDVALARPQGAPAVDTDGRRDHGRRRVRLGPRHPVRHPGAVVRQGLRRTVLVRGIDREGSRGALQRPPRRRPVRRRQRGGRRGRAPAKPAADDLRRLEERDRALADGAAALRAEEPARLRTAGGDERDHRDAAYRRGQAAAGTIGASA